MYYNDIPVESCVCTYRTMLYVPYVHTRTVHIVHTQGYDMRRDISVFGYFFIRRFAKRKIRGSPVPPPVTTA